MHISKTLLFILFGIGIGWFIHELRPNQQQIAESNMLTVPKPQRPAQNAIPAALIEALTKGDLMALSKYFAAEVDMELLYTEEWYSAKGATDMLTAFVREKPTTKVVLQHNSRSKGGNSQFQIATFESGGEQFRLYFLMENDKITELRITSLVKG